jgi:hypothetical protein
VSEWGEEAKLVPEMLAVLVAVELEALVNLLLEASCEPVALGLAEAAGPERIVPLFVG